MKGFDFGNDAKGSGKTITAKSTDLSLAEQLFAPVVNVPVFA
jgi:hypothetical protein